MRISYFLYSLLVSIWIFTDAPIQKVSRWWSVGTFILPLLVPYYLIKTRPQKKYWKYIGLWFLGFSVFYVTEIVFIGNNATINVSPQSRISKEIKSLNSNAESSFSKFQEAFNRLDRMDDINTIPKINEVISTIDLTQTLHLRAMNDEDSLRAYIKKHEKELYSENLNIFIELVGLKGKTYLAYHNALNKYLDTYKTMLEYLRNNYDAIYNGHQPESQYYEKLYSKLKIAIDENNKTLLQHRKFAQDYLSKHPKLAELLKGR